MGTLVLDVGRVCEALGSEGGIRYGAKELRRGLLFGPNSLDVGSRILSQMGRVFGCSLPSVTHFIGLGT